MARLLILVVPFLLWAWPAAASDCTVACDRELTACLARAAVEVRECQNAAKQDCAAACACEETEGATRIACEQRCAVCRDMDREVAGRDCDALDDELRDECDDAHDDCVRDCE